MGLCRCPRRALGTHPYDHAERIDVCRRARPDCQDPRRPLPCHDAGDGVHTVSECRQAMASVTGCACPARGHAGHGLQGWAPGGARRRVSLRTQLLTGRQKVATALGGPVWCPLSLGDEDIYSFHSGLLWRCLGLSRSRTPSVVRTVLGWRVSPASAALVPGRGACRLFTAGRRSPTQGFPCPARYPTCATTAC
jgi:hypothetical protein